MSEAKPKFQPKSLTHPVPGRKYAAETITLQSLRLIAAPDPKDDLSDEELAALCKDPRQSTDLIRQLIEVIKSI